MKVINLGSLNIDHVYKVDHLVKPGETIAAGNYELFPGGKGLNQSIALVRAGANVTHLGCVGREGRWLVEKLVSEGVDCSSIATANCATGHAMIQVDRHGENAIVIFGGANQAVPERDIILAIQNTLPGDWLLAQNETNGVVHAIAAAKAAGLRVAFNPAPMNDSVLNYPLDDVDLFFLNQTEAQQLTNQHDFEEIRRVMTHRYPSSAFVLTSGSHGAAYFNTSVYHSQAAEKVQALDTTAAGDTFIGYFLADLLTNGDPRKALKTACLAASICVTRPGAADSIPMLHELQEQ